MGKLRAAAELPSDGLIGVHQFPPRPVDRIFKLIAAGLARPYVSNAVIGKMLRPFRFD